MTASAHTLEQGQRVHYLANLGGLVVIAGLESCDPELLLGVFGEVADRLPKLSTQRQAQLRTQGRARLEARGAEKRAWSAWQQAQQLHQVVLTTDQLHQLIGRLGNASPYTTDDIVSVFMALVRALSAGADHGTH